MCSVGKINHWAAREKQDFNQYVVSFLLDLQCLDMLVNASDELHYSLNLHALRDRRSFSKAVEIWLPQSHVNLLVTRRSALDLLQSMARRAFCRSQFVSFPVQEILKISELSCLKFVQQFTFSCSIWIFSALVFLLCLQRLFWNQTRMTLGDSPVISTSCSFISASGRGLALKNVLEN